MFFFVGGKYFLVVDGYFKIMAEQFWGNTLLVASCTDRLYKFSQKVSYRREYWIVNYLIDWGEAGSSEYTIGWVSHHCCLNLTQKAWWSWEPWRGRRCPSWMGQGSTRVNHPGACSYHPYPSIQVTPHSPLGNTSNKKIVNNQVQWRIRIRMDPELWPGSGSGIIVWKRKSDTGSW